MPVRSRPQVWLGAVGTCPGPQRARPCVCGQWKRSPQQGQRDIPRAQTPFKLLSHLIMHPMAMSKVRVNVGRNKGDFSNVATKSSGSQGFRQGAGLLSPLRSQVPCTCSSNIFWELPADQETQRVENSLKTLGPSMRAVCVPSSPILRARIHL